MNFKTLLWLSSIFLCIRIAGAETTLRGMAVNGNLYPADYQVLADWNVNLVRYNFHNPDGDEQTVAEYNVWLAAEIAKLDAILPELAGHGMSVVLSVHTPPGGFVEVRPKPRHRVFAETEFLQAYLDSWETLASHYKNNATIFGYDLFNEPLPGTAAQRLVTWNDVLPMVIEKIRAVDQNHQLIIQPINGVAKNLRFLPLIADPKVIYSIHTYPKLSFIQQGLGRFEQEISYPSKQFKKKVLRRHLKPAVAFQRKRNARIYVGEFAVVRWAPNNSAYRYMEDCIRFFESKGWDWSYHAFREDDAWSVEHTTDRENEERQVELTDRGELLTSYFDLNEPTS